MRNLFLTLFIIMFSCSFLMTAVDAKRFGGSRSFGVSRSASQFSRPASAAAAQPASAPGNGMGKWLGPLAGFAAGGLLTSLFMGHGMGSGFLSLLLGFAAIFVLLRFLVNRTSAAPAQSQFQTNAVPQFSSPLQQAPMQSAVRANFDEADFLRQAKASFFRLQAAFDNKNLADLRAFTAPEVFAEIQMQLQERGDAPNQTDVLDVEAQLLDVSDENQGKIASVLFTAKMREEANAAFETVKETWHFRKDAYNSNWVVAGIQQ